MGRVKLSFKNPLAVPLTKCQINVECAGMMRPVQEKVRTIQANEEFNHSVLIVPRKEGSGTLVATFGSEEMIDVYGSCSIQVSA